MDLDRLVAKTSHSLSEVRIRALESLKFKLKAKLVSVEDVIAVNHGELAVNLLSWLDGRGDGRNETTGGTLNRTYHRNGSASSTHTSILELLSTLSQHAAGALAIRLRPEHERILRREIELASADTYDIASQLLQSLTIDSKDEIDQYENVAITTNKDHYQTTCNNDDKTPADATSSLSQVSTLKGRFTDTIESSGLKASFSSRHVLPSEHTVYHQQPTQPSSATLVRKPIFKRVMLMENDLRILSETAQWLHVSARPSSSQLDPAIQACDFLIDVLLQDYPAPVFLQNPEIFKNLIILLELKQDVLPATTLCFIHMKVLECLRVFILKLKTSLMLLSEPEFVVPKINGSKSQVVTSEKDDSIQTMDACIAVFVHATALIRDVTMTTPVLQLLWTIIPFLCDAEAESMIIQCIEALDQVLAIQRHHIWSDIRLINIVAFTLELVSACVSLSRVQIVVPDRLMDLFSVVVMSEHLAMMRPTMREIALLLIQARKHPSLIEFEQVDVIASGMVQYLRQRRECLMNDGTAISTALETTLPSSIIYLQRVTNVVRIALPSLQYTLDVELVHAFVCALCAAAINGRNEEQNIVSQAMLVLISLLTYPHDTIRIHAYRALLRRLQRAISMFAPLNTPGDATLSVYNNNYYYESDGEESDNVENTSSDNNHLQRTEAGAIMDMVFCDSNLMRTLTLSGLCETNVDIRSSVRDILGLILNSSLPSSILSALTVNVVRSMPLLQATAVDSIVGSVSTGLLGLALNILASPPDAVNVTYFSRNRNDEVAVVALRFLLHRDANLRRMGVSLAGYKDTIVPLRDLLVDSSFVSLASCELKMVQSLQLSEFSLADALNLLSIARSKTVEQQLKRSALTQLSVILHTSAFDQSLLDEDIDSIVFMIIRSAVAIWSPACIEIVTSCLAILRLLMIRRPTLRLHWSSCDGFPDLLLQVAILLAQHDSDMDNSDSIVSGSTKLGLELARMATLVSICGVDDTFKDDHLNEIADSIKPVRRWVKDNDSNSPLCIGVPEWAKRFLNLPPHVRAYVIEPVPEILAVPTYCEEHLPFLRIAYNINIHSGSIDAMLQAIELDEEFPCPAAEPRCNDFPTKEHHSLSLLPFDIQLFNCLHGSWLVTKVIADLQIADSHIVVKDCLVKLSDICFFDPESVRALLAKTDWQRAFSRFLVTLPTCPEDEELLSSVLSFLNFLLSSHMIEITSLEWLLRTASRHLLFLLAHNPSDVTDGLFTGNEEPKESRLSKKVKKKMLCLWRCLQEAACDANLDYIALHLYETENSDLTRWFASQLAYVNSSNHADMANVLLALKCLLHVTSQPLWSLSRCIEDPATDYICADMYALVEVLVLILNFFSKAYSEVRDGCEIFTGRAIYRASAQCLRHVCHEFIALLESGHVIGCWGEHWLNNGTISWIIPLLNDPDPVIRATTLGVISDLILFHDGRAMLFIAKPDILESIFEMLFNGGECSAVRKEAASIITNLFVEHFEYIQLMRASLDGPATIDAGNHDTSFFSTVGVDTLDSGSIAGTGLSDLLTSHTHARMHRRSAWVDRGDEWAAGSVHVSGSVTGSRSVKDRRYLGSFTLFEVLTENCFIERLYEALCANNPSVSTTPSLLSMMVRLLRNLLCVVSEDEAIVVPEKVWIRLISLLDTSSMMQPCEFPHHMADVYKFESLYRLDLVMLQTYVLELVSLVISEDSERATFFLSSTDLIPCILDILERDCVHPSSTEGVYFCEFNETMRELQESQFLLAEISFGLLNLILHCGCRRVSAIWHGLTRTHVFVNNVETFNSTEKSPTLSCFMVTHSVSQCNTGTTLMTTTSTGATVHRPLRSPCGLSSASSLRGDSTNTSSNCSLFAYVLLFNLRPSRPLRVSLASCMLLSSLLSVSESIQTIVSLLDLEVVSDEEIKKENHSAMEYAQAHVLATSSNVNGAVKEIVGSEEFNRHRNHLVGVDLMLHVNRYNDRLLGALACSTVLKMFAEVHKDTSLIGAAVDSDNTACTTVVITLGNLLSCSHAAKRFALCSGLLNWLLRRIISAHVAITQHTLLRIPTRRGSHGENENGGDVKVDQNVPHFVNLFELLGLLKNILAGSQDVKLAAADVSVPLNQGGNISSGSHEFDHSISSSASSFYAGGVSSGISMMEVIHLLWPLALTEEKLMVEILAVLANFVSNSTKIPGTISNDNYSSSERGTESTKGSTAAQISLTVPAPTGRSMLQHIMALLRRKGPITLTIFRCSFQVLASAARNKDCQTALWKTNFVSDCIAEIAPRLRKQKKLSKLNASLRFLASLAFTRGGQRHIMRVKDAVPLLCDFSMCKNDTTQALAYLILRNLCFLKANRSLFVADGGSMLTFFVNGIAHHAPNVSLYAASALWTLLYNNQIVKAIFKQQDILSRCKHAEERISRYSVKELSTAAMSDSSQQSDALDKVARILRCIITNLQN